MVRTLSLSPRHTGWVDRFVGLRYPLVAAASVVIALLNRRVLPTDYVAFSGVGRLVWDGSWGSVFADKTIQAGPLQLALISAFRPLALIRPHLDVVALHLVGSVAVALGLMWGGAQLRRAAGSAAAPRVELAVGVLALWWGLVDDPSALGHPAQVVVPALWVIAAVGARQNRPIIAGAALAVGSGFETWALLGAAVLLLSPSVRSAIRAAAVATGTTAVIWLPFVLAGPFNMLRMEWEVERGTLIAQILGSTSFTSTMRLMQLAVAVAASAGVALLTRSRSESVWLVPTAAVVARLAFDPLQFSYYWVAPLLLTMLAVMCTTGLRRPSTVGVLALMYCQVIANDGAAKPAMLAASAGLLVVLMRLSRPPRTTVADRAGGGGPRQTRTADILVVSEAL